MSENSSTLRNDHLSEKTFIFGLHLRATVGICVGVAFVLLLFLISICFAFRRSRTTNSTNQNLKPSSFERRESSTPSKSKEIKEIMIVDPSLTAGTKTFEQALQKPMSGSVHYSGSMERRALFLLPLKEESPISVEHRESSNPSKLKEIKEIMIVDPSLTAGTKTFAQALQKPMSGSVHYSGSMERRALFLLPLKEESPISVEHRESSNPSKLKEIKEIMIVDPSLTAGTKTFAQALQKPMSGSVHYSGSMERRALFLLPLKEESPISVEHRESSNPSKLKEIKEIMIVDPSLTAGTKTFAQALQKPMSGSVHHSGSMERRALFLLPLKEESPISVKKVHVNTGKDHPELRSDNGGAGAGSSRVSVDTKSAEQIPTVAPKVSPFGWGHWYTLRELEVATDMFAAGNVLGEGGYGVVYHGVLEDQTQVAVKKLLNNRGQAEREFKVEVDAIGRVRHKNLVRLLGYCAEGAHRMLVYEYLNNGNLEQWLHGEIGSRSPLTWDIRMNIILGIAKGLMYLHEGLEPKVVHRDVKASNILLDKNWNAKISDFGLAKLMGSERSHVTTRVMGTFGYVAPEYASTGMLSEKSDVYSFGILIMEIISGRNPVDYHRPSGEVNLVEWLKVTVSNQNSEVVLDQRLPEKPNSRALKRTLFVALRCVDPDSTKRPKMSHLIHMLEADDYPY